MTLLTNSMIQRFVYFKSDDQMIGRRHFDEAGA